MLRTRMTTLAGFWGHLCVLKKPFLVFFFFFFFFFFPGVVGWCEGAVYLTSPGRPTDIGLQLGKACYPCSG